MGLGYFQMPWLDDMTPLLFSKKVVSVGDSNTGSEGVKWAPLGTSVGTWKVGYHVIFKK